VTPRLRLRSRVRFWFVASAVVAGIASAHAQSPAPAQAPLVAKASQYVDAYRNQFSAVVCEERQTQHLVKPDGRVSKTRTLVSDLMFVKLPDVWVLQAFRDVFSVDDKPVRNRDERLRKLFLGGQKNAVEQARAIADESGRYNLGVDRAGNSPLLPILVLDPHVVGNFAFVVDGSRLTFTESKTPTLLSFRRSGARGDLPANGSMRIDPGSGAILQATLTAAAPDAPIATTFTVNYLEDAKLKMLVPSDMTEQYTLPAKPKDDHFEGTATYTSCRRFEVVVSETIK
jgi:hypothetical protein